MQGMHINSKARDTAKVLSAEFNVDFPTALQLTQAIWEEARKCILKITGTEGWQRLSLSERAYVCQSVVKALMNKKNVIGFLSGERKTIV
ncbi:MAG: hypothetical protein HYS21_13770 [Deltaproteobacteria bacterium]|nr:hypothetical protein [Deltaproteobacteria bacterium]